MAWIPVATHIAQEQERLHLNSRAVINCVREFRSHWHEFEMGDQARAS